MSARPIQPSAHALRVLCPETRQAIENVFRKAFPGDEDYCQEVLLKLLAHPDPPETIEGCRYLAIRMAQDMVVDILRRRSVRRRVSPGPTEDADSHASPGPDASEVLAARQLLAFVAEQEEAGNISGRQATILRDVADGASHGEIAGRLKVAQKTVRNEVVKARKELHERWQARLSAVSKPLAIGLFALLLWNLFCPTTPRRDVAKDTAPKPEVPTTPEALGPGSRARATELRRSALHACDVGEWKECVDGLDQAKALDPEGDDKPAVQEARARAAGAKAAPEHHPAPRPQPRTRAGGGEK